MITSFTLPKTEHAISELKKEIYAYYKENPKKAQEVFGASATDEHKVLTLLEDVLTRDQLVDLVAEELKDIKAEEEKYKEEHPNFPAMKGAIDLATKYLNEDHPEAEAVTISLIQDGDHLTPKMGIVENATNWYRFTQNDIDLYLNRVDYYEDYRMYLEELAETLKKEHLVEEDKTIITTYLTERRNYWIDREETKTERHEDVGEDQLTKAIFQAFINKVVTLPTKEPTED